MNKPIDVNLNAQDAVELHEAVAPWEAKTAPFGKFLLILGAVSVLGLAIGSVIDNTVAFLQGRKQENPRWSCTAFFFVQIVINITGLFLANRLLKFPFVPSLLITLAGFLFLLLLFNTQDTLTQNALCVIKF